MIKKRTFFAVFVTIYINAVAQDKPRVEAFEFPFGPYGEETRGVFGADDRKEIKDATTFSDYARATAVMIPKSSISGNKVYATTLRTRLSKMHGTVNFDDNVRFLDQPACANCTGFLIAPDIIVTAGHCIETMKQAEDYVWLFDYTVENDYNAKAGYFTIKPENVYEVKEVLGAYFQDIRTYTDYSVVRLANKTKRKPYRFRTGGKVALGSEVYTIGSPTGLPLKLADNAIVVDNSQEKWFKNNVDGFPGNSGGPVFNPSGFIEGIHVRGAVELSQGYYVGDYKYDKECDCIKTVQWETTDDNGGSHAHRITAVPRNLLNLALYENLEFAITQNDLARLEDWLVYSWFLEDEYTVNRGRIEFVAAKQNSIEALQLVIEKLENVNSTDSRGRNLLFYAIDNSNMAMLNLLLTKGISPNKPDNSGITPIMEAVYSEKLDMASLLLKRGAKTIAVDNSGNTPLHIAAYLGNIPMVKLLLENGANAKAENNKGWKPRKVARKQKHKEVSKYLKKAAKGKL